MANQTRLKGDFSVDVGVLTDRMDVGTEDFEDFKFFILSKSRSRTKDQKILFEIASIKYRMQNP